METATKQQPTEKTTVIYSAKESAIADGRERERKNRLNKRRLFVVLAWTAVVLVVGFLVLLLSSKIGRFESIGDMLYFINQHFVYSELVKPS